MPVAELGEAPPVMDTGPGFDTVSNEEIQTHPSSTSSSQAVSHSNTVLVQSYFTLIMELMHPEL